jgi:hypothetical protein
VSGTQGGFTEIQRACALRHLRVARDNVKRDASHLEQQARLGDHTANAAHVALAAELEILQGVIRQFWILSGADPPPDC